MRERSRGRGNSRRTTALRVLELSSAMPPVEESITTRAPADAPAEAAVLSEGKCCRGRRGLEREAREDWLGGRAAAPEEGKLLACCMLLRI